MLVGVCRLAVVVVVAVADAAAVSAVAVSAVVRTVETPGNRHRGVAREELASLEVQRIPDILAAGADVGHMIDEAAGAGAGAGAAKVETRTLMNNRRLVCRADETAVAGT